MEIVPRLKDFLSTEIPASMRTDFRSVDPDEDLLAQGLIDSMVLLKLVSFLEETFGVKVFDEDVTKENWTPLKTPVRGTRRVYLVDLIPVCSRSDS